MKAKKKSILILLISLPFFFISCSTNNDKIEEFKDIKFNKNTETKQSKIILGNDNLTFAFSIKSINNIGTKQSKIILRNDNLMIAFNTKPINSIDANFQK
ncbi:hypothetical protein ACFQZW_04385 [Lutibacter aestuarii]|uniref:Lipoprotein n=1 Tax=Lutibacter aestuarii TaxID=861111 RepID=A0ABW2Z8X6_9FLAO